MEVGDEIYVLGSKAGQARQAGQAGKRRSSGDNTEPTGTEDHRERLRKWIEEVFYVKCSGSNGSE